MIVIVDGKKYDTDKLERLIDRQGNQRHANGVTLLGVWEAKDGVLVVTDSVWENRQTGGCIGTVGHFASTDEIASLADRYGGPIMDLVPEGE